VARVFTDLTQDVRYAVRGLRRAKVFAFAAIASLALGIGANVAIFSIIDALILRPLPLDHPDQLVFVNRTAGPGGDSIFSFPQLARFRTAAPDVPLAAMSGTGSVQFTIDRTAELAVGQLVTANWFDVLGVHAVLGHLLGTTGDEAIDAEPFVVLSEGFWTSRFGRDPSIVGRTLLINRLPFTIVGVAGTFSGVTVGQAVNVWMPVAMQHALGFSANSYSRDADSRKPWLTQGGIEWLMAVARVPPAVDRAVALARLDHEFRVRVAARANATSDPDERALILRDHLELRPGARGLSPLRDELTPALILLMATVSLLLVVACANLANLLLARSAGRVHEFAIRASLGASHSRMVRQCLTESLLLSTAGGALGLVVARLSGAALLRLASNSAAAVPLVLPTDVRLLAFGFGASILTGVCFGLAPAARLARADATAALRSAGRVVSLERPHAVPWRRLVVVLQVAVSLTLLTGAVFFTRTFANLLNTRLGFEDTRVLAARFDPRLAGLGPRDWPGLIARILDGSRRIPGVVAATLGQRGPISGSQLISGIVAEGGRVLPAEDRGSREEYVAPDYFDALGMRLVAGRDFSDRDAGRAPKVAVVNETMARQFFGDVQVVGRRFGYGTPADTEIIGVVANAKIDGAKRPVPPMIYRPFAEFPDEEPQWLYVRVAAAGPPANTVRRDISRAIADADPGLAVREVVTLEELSHRLLSRERLVSALTSGFSLLAVLVACLGLYSAVSYAVVRRTTELGIRLALGASRGRVQWLVLRETLLLVACGVLVGVAATFVGVTYVGSLVFGLSPRDPSTIVGAALGLTGCAILASVVPAWRASRLDVLRALSH
jgi:predicted permease